MSFLDQWWEERRAELKAEREALERREPVVPATYGTATGEPTVAPWSAVAGAVNRIKPVIDLNKLKASVFKALGVKL